MGYAIQRRLLSAAVLAVVLPLSFFVVFKFTGIIPEPSVAETITAETKTCNIERIKGAWTWMVAVENLFADFSSSINFTVSVDTYSSPHFWYPSAQDFCVFVTASVGTGFVNDILIQMRKGFNNTSMVDIIYDEDVIVAQNLTLVSVLDSGGGSEARLSAVGGRDTQSCLLKVPVDWIFLDDTIDDNLTMTASVTFYNGTAYRRILLPITIFVRTDAGSSFETARPINFGQYNGRVSYYDEEDFYSVFFETNQTVNVKVTGLPYLQVSIYDPNRNLIASSNLDIKNEFTFKTEVTGQFYIRLSTHGVYTLSVSLST
ncbi:MAG: hypothetical protein QXJ02_03615 [Candidatus Bathyarchaeia archaeon]